MKKALAGLTLALLLAPAVSFAQAPLTQEEAIAQMQGLIQQLLTMVQALTEQLNKAIAEQNAKLDTIQTQTVQTQSAPVLGSAPVAPDVSFGTAYCRQPSDNPIWLSRDKWDQWKKENAVPVLPFTVSGVSWNYLYMEGYSEQYPKEKGQRVIGHEMERSRAIYEAGILPGATGTVTITTQLGMVNKPNSFSPASPEFTLTDTVVIGQVCN